MALALNSRYNYGHLLFLLLLMVSLASAFYIQYPYRNLRIGSNMSNAAVRSVTLLSSTENDVTTRNQPCSMSQNDPKVLLRCAQNIPVFFFNRRSDACEEYVGDCSTAEHTLFINVQECRQSCV